jgi:hypothetical protein
MVGRKVSSREERTPIRREKHAHRPAATARQRHCRRHIDVVEIRPLLAIDLDADKVAIEKRGHGFVLEAFRLRSLRLRVRRRRDSLPDRRSHAGCDACSGRHQRHLKCFRIGGNDEQGKGKAGCTGAPWNLALGRLRRSKPEACSIGRGSERRHCSPYPGARTVRDTGAMAALAPGRGVLRTATSWALAVAIASERGIPGPASLTPSPPPTPALTPALRTGEATTFGPSTVAEACAAYHPSSFSRGGSQRKRL